ncbi:MAG TPA: baseplate J/gp47 family protein, partial [Myxococcus sp.]|nr:baseplate J/gp47 family protein [Myxococcus sp.]
SSYLARDYESFTRLMLERLQLTVPGWQERHAADLGMVLVELLAHAGDLLSYYQDAVSAEAYLGTARRRTSLRRHARLLDYLVHEGCNARTWVHLTLAPGVDSLELPAGTCFLTEPESPPPGEASVHHPRPLVFESMAPARLYEAHNTFQLYTWGAERDVLPAGATSALLTGHFPRLRTGDVLILEELGTGPHAGEPGPRRHPVRLSAAPILEWDRLADPLQPLTRVSWFPEDALPFALDFGRSGSGGFLSQVLGNVVLADQGRTHTQQLQVDAAGGPVRLRLRGLRVGCAESWDEAFERTRPAAEALVQSPHRTLPSVQVHELREDRDAPRGEHLVPWSVQVDLLSSSRFERHFVAELDDGEALVLRFGDGQLGRRMRPGTRLQVTWRDGVGATGNVAAGALRFIAGFPDQVLSVRNPLAARGGQFPEDAERVRRDAPRAFYLQERCITEEDFSQLAQRLAGVRQASTRLTWDGTRHVARVHVLAHPGRVPGAHLLARLQEYLFRHSLLGTEVEVLPPVLVPLDITLRVGVRPRHVPAPVRRALEQELGSGELPDGRTGFFHPSAFGLGQPVYLAPLVARAAAVPGVAWVEAVQFQRRGLNAASALDSGRIPIEPHEVALVEGQPGRPDLGRVRILLAGEHP